MENIEQLIKALNDAMTRFVDSDEDEPNYLYIDRKDGVWDAVFMYSPHSSPLAMEMFEWVTGEDAIHDLALCQSGNTRKVAEEIISGWDPEWDS